MSGGQVEMEKKEEETGCARWQRRRVAKMCLYGRSMAISPSKTSWLFCREMAECRGLR